MSFAVRMLPEPLRTLNSATLAGSFVVIGTPLANKAVLVKMTNLSTVNVTVSWGQNTSGGVVIPTNLVADDVCPAGGFWLYDITANRSMDGQGLFIAKGTQFYVSGAAGVGNIYLTVLYGRE